jgi:hypothetical protein
MEELLPVHKENLLKMSFRTYFRFLQELRPLNIAELKKEISFSYFLSHLCS